MTPKQKAAMQQALEFLTNDRWGTWPYMDICVFEDAQRLVAALQEALAEPAQKPVAWRYKYADGFWRFSNGERVNGCDPVESQPLYTAPPQRKPLTNEEIEALLPEPDGTAEVDTVRVLVAPGLYGTEYTEADAWKKESVIQVVRAIEAFHEITGENT